MLVDDHNDFLDGGVVVCADGIVDSGAAVQIGEDELADLIQLGREDADTALDVVAEDDHYKIVDVDGDEELPFWLTDTQVENGFEIKFKDGETVALEFVDQATIIDHMIGLWEEHRDTYLANHQ